MNILKNLGCGLFARARKALLISLSHDGSAAAESISPAGKGKVARERCSG
jgi:hypothetical protein